MWELNNFTPFSAFAGFERDKHGRSKWTVWAKATFRLRHGRSALFDREQVELVREPAFKGAVNASELLQDIDITPRKSRADIVISANGHAPRGQRFDQPFTVKAEVGDWRKSLTVHPAYRWDQDLRPRLAGENWSPVPLGYESAYGGVDGTMASGAPAVFESNPIGVGFYRSKEAARNGLLPRVMPVGATYRDWNSALPFDAFAAISRSWPQRSALVGTFDRQWKRTKAPFLPDDFQEAYWQCAPESQRAEAAAIEGSEVRLTNMMPVETEFEGEAFSARLPRLQFECFTRFKGQWVEAEMQLQTLHIDAESQRASMTWCAELPTLAAGNDVMVEKTDLVLRGHEGFSILPQDMARFRREEVEVA